MSLNPGAKVVLSDVGLAKLGNMRIGRDQTRRIADVPQRVGVVTGAKGNTRSVIWEGRATPDRYVVTFLKGVCE